MVEANEPKLLGEDFNTPTWARLVAVLEERLRQQRGVLESATDHGDMIRAQARIKELRQLLGLRQDFIDTNQGVM